jgi:hypothetical protein
MAIRIRTVGWHMNVCFADPAHAARYYQFVVGSILGIENTLAMEAFVVTKVWALTETIAN